MQKKLNKTNTQSKRNERRYKYKSYVTVLKLYKYTKIKNK